MKSLRTQRLFHRRSAWAFGQMHAADQPKADHMNNNTEALIIRNDATMRVTFSLHAEEMKEVALCAASVVGRVTSVEEQERAVDAQKALQTLLNAVESARQFAKEPVLTFGRSIDQAAKDFIEELKAEMLRISTLIGTYQQQELARQRAEQQAQNEKLLAIEREKAAALAKAKTEAEVDAVQEHYNNKAAVMAPPPAEPARANGQRIVTDWDIVVTDIHELYRHHPNAVKMEPRLSEIKELLKRGDKVRGVRASEVVRAGVRVGSQLKAIEV